MYIYILLSLKNEGILPIAATERAEVPSRPVILVLLSTLNISAAFEVSELFFNTGGMPNKYISTVADADVLKEVLGELDVKSLELTPAETFIKLSPICLMY